jgi:hypothetical protein
MDLVICNARPGGRPRSSDANATYMSPGSGAHHFARLRAASYLTRVVHAFTSIRHPGRIAARVIGVLGIAASLVACGRSTAPQLALTSAAPKPDYPTAIAQARAARDRAFALHAPSPGALAAASTEEAVTETLRQWAASRREATQDAHRAYAEALHAVPGPADEAEAYGEIAELWLRLEEDTRSALFAATPASYRDDPSLVSAVQGAAVYALRPLLDRVGSALRACEHVLSETPSAPAAVTCAAVAARLKQADDPPASSAAQSVAAAIPVAPARPIVATTHPKPCTFKGTLFTRGAVYESESGSAVVLPIEHGTSIEVESLAVASAPGGRYRVVVSWPKAVVGYLDAKDGPFVLTRTVELEPGAVWAAEGERVAASDTRGATVLAARPKLASGSPPGAVSGDRRLFCHDLELATPRHTDARVGALGNDND